MLEEDYLKLNYTEVAEQIIYDFDNCNIRSQKMGAIHLLEKLIITLKQKTGLSRPVFQVHDVEEV